MKKRKTFFLALVAFGVLNIVITNLASAQNYYEDSYDELKDALFYPRIDSLLNERKMDDLLPLSAKAFDHYWERGEKDRAVFLFNVCLYYPTGYGMGDQSMPLLLDKMDFLRKNMDTNNIHFATLQHIVAFGYKAVEAYEKAEPLLLSAISVYENKGAADLHLYSAYQSLGNLYIYNKSFWKVYQYSQKALEGYKSNETDIEYYRLQKKHDIATIYLNLALAMEETQQDELSYAFNKKALDLFLEYFPESINHVVTAVNLSSDCRRMGDYEAAVEWAIYADSCFFAAQNMDWYYMVYNYIPALKGDALTQLGMYKEAEIYYRELLSHYQKYYGNNPEMQAGVYQKIATNSMNAGELDSALFYYEKALKLDSTAVETYSMIAEVYSEMGEYDLAIAKIEKEIIAVLDLKPGQLPVAGMFENDHKSFEKCHDLSAYYLQAYLSDNDRPKLDNSIYYSRLGDTLIGRYRDATLIGSNETALAENYNGIANTGIEASYLAYGVNGRETDAINILRFFTQSNAFKLNAEVAQSGLVKTGKDSLIKEQIKLLQAIRKLENEKLALKAKKPGNKLTKVEEALFKKRLQAFELSYQLQEKPNELLTGAFHVDADFTAVQENLDDGEALLSYHFTDDHLFALLILKNDYIIKKLARSGEVKSWVRKYYRAIKTASGNLEESSYKLYEILFATFETDLKKIENIAIVADGVLNQVPFEALMYDEKGTAKYLIERFGINYSYSIYLWLKGQEAKNRDVVKRFAGFAPVFMPGNNVLDENFPIVYDESLGSEFAEFRDGDDLKPLPYSATEVSELHNLFTRNGWLSNIYVNSDANESNFKQKGKDYHILHIATHGYSSSSKPELSGLFLKKPDSSDQAAAEDGFVYFGEIYTMPVNADLVVLSACKSGVGKILEGEGVMALPRAFIFNGVPNILVSLWKVHDEKTKDLMVDFYTGFLSGKAYPEALRQAKLKQIEKGEHPLDWSGFVLIGY